MFFILFGDSITYSPLMVVAAYISIGFIYLVLAPILLFYWMNNRWNIMGKIEPFLIYGLVFLFFPGLVLFAPFFNLRMNGQIEDSK